MPPPRTWPGSWPLTPRDAQARIEGVALPALDTLRADLEEALGLKYEGTKADPDKGEHFFRSTLVQTIFYGVFSAWVLWIKKQTTTDQKARFRWREATWPSPSPMIKALFEQLSITSENCSRLTHQNPNQRTFSPLRGGTGGSLAE